MKEERARSRGRKTRLEVEQLERRDVPAAPVIDYLMLSSSWINEGDTVSLSGSVSDVDGGSHQITIDWADGSQPTTLSLSEWESSFYAEHQYPDDNPSGTSYDFLTINVTATDAEFESGWATTDITVSNVQPQLSASIGPVDENGVATLSGSITDPGTDSFTLMVWWGDGGDSYSLPAGTSYFEVTHQYLDDNPSLTPWDQYALDVMLTDDDGGSAWASPTVMVNNVSPTLSNLAATTIDENGFTTLTGEISDLGSLDMFSLEVWWGDGGMDFYNFGAGATSFMVTHQYLDDNPTGTPVDSYNIGLTLSDDDTGSAQADVPVQVNNVAPTVSNVSASDVSEMGFTTLSGIITDPSPQDTVTLVVDWGDSTSSTYTYGPSTGSILFAESHQYLDDNPTATPEDVYTISWTVTDDDTGAVSGSTQLTVSNVAPTLSLSVTPTVSEGGSVVLTGSITDASPFDSFTLRVNWADDSPVEVVSYAAGTTDFTLTHHYQDDGDSPGNGTFSDQVTITAELEDDDTGIAYAFAELTVNNESPMLSNVWATSANEGEAVTVTGSISDPGAQDGFTLTTTWNDGQQDTYTFAPGTTSFTISHTYLDDGYSPGNGTSSDQYQIDLVLEDDDTGTAFASASTTIYNVAPAASLSLVHCAYPGSPAELAVTVTDQGVLDVLSGEVEWGDNPGGQPESFSFTGGGTASIGHVYAEAGTYTVHVRASDDDLGYIDVYLQLEVEALPELTWAVTNQPPLLSLADRTDSEGSEVNFTIQAIDPENHSISYGALNLPKGLSIGRQTGQVSGTLDYSLPYDTTYQVTIVAVDQQGASASASFAWTVTDQNRAPQLTLPGDQSVTEGDSVMLQAQGTDEDGDRLIYFAENLPAGVVIDSLSGLISGSVAQTAAASGPYTAVVSVWDGKTTTEQTFTWSVTAVNEPPQIDPVEDQDSMYGDSVQLEVLAIDADEDPLTYSADGLPDGLTIDANTGLIEGTISASGAAASPYSVTLTVSDGLASATSTFSWSVSPIRIVSPGDQSNFEGDYVVLGAQASHAGGSSLYYMANGLPDGLYIMYDTGVIFGTLTAGSVGLDQLVTVYASDGTTTAHVSFLWSVLRLSNNPPTIDDPGPQQSTVGGDVSLAISASDPDGDMPTFSAAGLPSGLSIDESSGLIWGTILSSAAAASPYAVSVTADDGFGGVATLSFSWTVELAPLAVQGYSLSATEGQPFSSAVASFTSGNPYAQAHDFSAAIAWGDGSTGVGFVSWSEWTGFVVEASHVYAHPGTYTAIIELTETETGQTSTAPSTVEVASAPVSGLAGLALTALRGQSRSFRLAAFRDPSPNDAEVPYQVVFDWGDGAPVSMGTAAVTGQAVLTSADHVFEGLGTFTVSVTLTDQDGHTATVQGQVQVGDLYAGSEATLTIAEFEEGQGSTVTIDWGDGTSSQASGLSGQHAYAQPGFYTVQVHVTGDCEFTLQDQVQVVSAPVDLMLGALLPAENIENDALAGLLTNANPTQSEIDLALQIDWADGSMPSAGTVAGADGLFEVFGEHEFGQSRPYTLTAGVYGPASQLMAFAVAVADYNKDNFRQGFLDTLEAEVRNHLNRRGETSEWQVHHSAQQGSNYSQTLADRLLARKPSINVHHPSNLYLVPNRSVHAEIGVAQMNWWRQEMKTFGWKTYEEAFAKVNLNRYLDAEVKIRAAYKDLMVPANGTLADLNKVRQKLGLNAVTPGQASFVSVGAESVLAAFRKGRPSRLASLAKKLGITVGVLGLLGTVASGAVVINNIANPDGNMQNKFSLMMNEYQSALMNSPIDIVQWGRLTAAVDAYLIAIGVNEEARALVSYTLVFGFLKGQ